MLKWPIVAAALGGLFLLAIGVSHAARLSQSSPAGTVRFGHGESLSDPLLFVGGVGNNTVHVYDLDAHGTPLVEVITQGIDGPGGMFVDGGGTLYVANQYNKTVTEYPPGQTTPSVTLSKGITAAQTVGVSPDGTVYVADPSSTPGILVFKRGKDRPARLITSPLIISPNQMVFTDDRTMLMADNTSGVLAITIGNRPAVVTSLGLQNLDGCMSGLALDRHARELFVSDCDGGTQVYPVGGQLPLRNLDASFPADQLALGAIERAGILFAPDLYTGQVFFYRHGATEPFKSIDTGTADPVAMAYKPAGIP
jgi:hypothetical protein